MKIWFKSWITLLSSRLHRRSKLMLQQSKSWHRPMIKKFKVTYRRSKDWLLRLRVYKLKLNSWNRRSQGSSRLFKGRTIRSTKWGRKYPLLKGRWRSVSKSIRHEPVRLNTNSKKRSSNCRTVFERPWSSSFRSKQTRLVSFRVNSKMLARWWSKSTASSTRDSRKSPSCMTRGLRDQKT